MLKSKVNDVLYLWAINRGSEFIMKIILKSPQIINEISELLIGAKLVPTELEKK